MSVDGGRIAVSSVLEQWQSGSLKYAGEKWHMAVSGPWQSAVACMLIGAVALCS